MENSSHQQQKWIIDQAVDAAAAAAADMNNNGDYRVDLTLKLGLPDHHAQNNNPTFAGPNNQGMDQSAIVNQGAMIQAQQSFNGRHCAWPFQCDHPMASNVQIMSHPNAFNHFGGATMGFPCYGNNFAPQQLPPSPILGSAPPMNHYTLLDVPPRRASIDDGGSSASGSGGRMSYRRLRGGGNYNDPNKRCTNYNCNTNDTPMWRKGPLGPKTLCNACGIKFRKEEEKRRGKEA